MSCGLWYSMLGTRGKYLLTSSGQMINLKLSRSSGSGNSVPHVFGRLSSFMSENVNVRVKGEQRGWVAGARVAPNANLLWFSAVPRTPSSGCQPWVTRHLFSLVSTRIIWSYLDRAFDTDAGQHTNVSHLGRDRGRHAKSHLKTYNFWHHGINLLGWSRWSRTHTIRAGRAEANVTWTDKWSWACWCHGVASIGNNVFCISRSRFSRRTVIVFFSAERWHCSHDHISKCDVTLYIWILTSRKFKLCALISCAE